MAPRFLPHQYSHAGRKEAQMVNSKCKVPTYVEYTLRFCTTRVGVLFAEGYELLGQALRFFCFGPGRLDGFVGYEGGDEVAEEGLAVRGLAI